MPPFFLHGIILGLAEAFSPGPLQAFYMSQTMIAGWRRTTPTALAPLVSDGPIILLVLVLLSQTPDWLMRVIRIGVGYFLSIWQPQQ